MRTRFLATDYFAENLGIDILRLPVPDDIDSGVSPPSGGMLDFSCFCFNPIISDEIDRIPFEGALSQFLDEVVPRIENVQLDPREGEQSVVMESASGGSQLEESQELVCFLYGEKEMQRNSAYVSSFCQCATTEGNTVLKWFPFELVKLDDTLRKCENCCGEEAGFCLEYVDVEVPMDVVEIDLGETIPYPHEIVRSICLVEDIPVSRKVDQDKFNVQYSHSLDTKPNHTPQFFQFEINETVYEHGFDVFKHNNFESLFSNLETWNKMEGDMLVVDIKEFAGSCIIDFLDPLRQHDSGNFIEERDISLSSLLGMGIVSIQDKMLLDKFSALFPLTSNGECSDEPCSVTYEEVEVLDYSTQMCPIFESQHITKIEDISEQMLKADMNVAQNIYESIISSELFLSDDMFKSLPAPVLYDEDILKPLSLINRAILCAFKPHVSPASDRIYLDWHILLEDSCSRDICCSYINMIEDLNASVSASEMITTCDDILVMGLDFFDDCHDMLKFSQDKEVPTELQVNEAEVSIISSKPAISQTLENNTGRNTYDVQLSNPSFKNVPVANKAKSQYDDLNFFIDLRRGSNRNCKDTTVKSVDGKVTPVVHSEATDETTAAPMESLEQWDVVVHKFSLSDHILSLINDIENIIRHIVVNCMELRRRVPVPAANNFKSLSVSKQLLMDLISEKSTGKLNSEDETFISCIVLYAAKHMAYFLCFYGVHVAYLYIKNLISKIGFEIPTLRSLESSIEVIHQRVEGGFLESHPSLSLVEEILTKSSSKSGNKILVIAEDIFWLPLNQKLISLRIKAHQLRQQNLLETHDCCGSENSVDEALRQSDCLLISREHISASFSFNKFSIILEYGGPYSSSSMSSISPNMCGLPQVHFLKIDMNNHCHAKALCEGFEASRHLKNEKEKMESHESNLKGSSCKDYLIELLNFMPRFEKNTCTSSGSGNGGHASSDNCSTMRYPEKQNSVVSVTPTWPELIIIVNTQNFKKKMLLSRRSSYQKILTLEKGGIQIVERDINLPLDLIFSASVCMVWYEAGVIRDDGISNPGISTISMFIENVATDVLMSLSFSFSSCIMIFEGESSFLSAIMESSDALYAAAASLDVNLQLFCSYVPESTDEIILNCIKKSTGFGRGTFPAMPDTETLGESFLTSFPSINPLSAHAILSSGGILVEFLEWSNELRIQAVSKYQVSDLSISLFSDLCRYGELAESKSVMTECTSIDSGFSNEMGSQRKKQKTSKMMMGNSLYFEPVNQTDDGTVEDSQASQPYKQRFYDAQDTWGQAEKHMISMHSGISDIKQGLDSFTISDQDSNITKGCDFVSKDLMKTSGNASNCNTSMFLNERTPPMLDDATFSWKPKPSSESQVRNFIQASKSASESMGHRIFPTSAEISMDSDRRTPQRIPQNNLEMKYGGWSDIGDMDASSTAHKGNASWDHMQFNQEDIDLPPVLEKASPFCFNDLYPNAKQMEKRAQPKKTSTIDFINRVKEKRQMLQQTLKCNTCLSYPGSLMNKDKYSNQTCNTCLSCPGSLMNKDKYSKKRSPSIIETYKYEGANPTKKTVRNKWSKNSRMQVNSSGTKRKYISSFSPSWTPTDKRARQNLSFMRNGNEKQSKLVWRHGNSPAIGYNLKKG